MEKIHKQPYKSTNRKNLQSMQYKILNKIINCNYWLHKLTIKDTPKCRFCLEDETVEHFFYGCKVTKAFWKAFQTWWNQYTENEINIIYEKDVILGYDRDTDEFKVFNCCILIGKSMIYQQKYYDKQPDIYTFHCELKDYLAIETNIALKTNLLDTLNKHWGEILNL